MAIAKKYRRKLVVGKRLFVWWVREIQPEDWIGPVLTVASDDKRFLVRSAPRPSGLVSQTLRIPGLLMVERDSG